MDKGTKIIIGVSIAAIAVVGIVLLRKPKPTDPVVPERPLTFLEKLKLVVDDIKSMNNNQQYTQEQQEAAKQVAQTLSKQPLILR